VILGFAHPCLVVSDVDAAREFYEKMFGFRLLSDEGWSNAPGVDVAIGSKHSSCRGYMLEGHNCHLEIFEFTAPQQAGPDPSSLGPHEQGIRHLAFYVDDCRAEYERLLSLGGNMLGEPVDIGGGIYTAYCRDPFGNIVELCEIPTEAEDPRNLPGIKQLGNYSG
jgi:catechol 2,3-dioxygenase-like lactoylglutathione lyase family enzyme